MSMLAVEVDKQNDNFNVMFYQWMALLYGRFFVPIKTFGRFAIT